MSYTGADTISRCGSWFFVVLGGRSAPVSISSHSWMGPRGLAEKGQVSLGSPKSFAASGNALSPSSHSYKGLRAVAGLHLH